MTRTFYKEKLHQLFNYREQLLELVGMGSTLTYKDKRRLQISRDHVRIAQRRVVNRVNTEGRHGNGW